MSKASHHLTYQFAITAFMLLLSCHHDSDNRKDITGPGITAQSNPLIVMAQGDTVLDFFKRTTDTTHALDSLAAWFRSVSIVSSAQISDDSLSVGIIFKDGLHANYSTVPPFYEPPREITLDHPEDSLIKNLSKRSKMSLRNIGGGHAKIVAVFGDGMNSIEQSIQKIRDSLTILGYPVEIEDTSTVPSFNEDYFRSLFNGAPEVLVLFTHGVFFGQATYGLMTREEYLVYDSGAQDNEYIGLARYHGTDYKVLMRSFISQNFDALHFCFLELHACNAALDNNLINAFTVRPDSVVVFAHTSAARGINIQNIITNLYRSLSDTFTIQQAYNALPSANRANTILVSKPNADVLLAETFTCSVGPSHDHFNSTFVPCTTHVSGTRVPGYTITSFCCAGSAGGPCDTSINIVVPSTIGTHTLADGVIIVLNRGSPLNGFISANGFIGVSGSVTLLSVHDGFISGNYSAVLGRWETGKIPTDAPPIETVNLNGRFKIDN